MATLKNLQGDRDDLVAMEMANNLGRSFTIEEIVKIRRNSVAKFRLVCKQRGISLPNSDDEVYDIILDVMEVL